MVQTNDQSKVSRTVAIFPQPLMHASSFSSKTGHRRNPADKQPDAAYPPPVDRGAESHVQSDIQTGNLSIDSPKSYKLPERSYVRQEGGDSSNIHNMRMDNTGYEKSSR